MTDAKSNVILLSMTDPRVFRIADEVVRSLGDKSWAEFLVLLEEYVVKIAMRQSKENCLKAAILLGVNRTTLVEMRRRHGMVKERGGRKKKDE